MTGRVIFQIRLGFDDAARRLPAVQLTYQHLAEQKARERYGVETGVCSESGMQTGVLIAIGILLDVYRCATAMLI